MFPGQFPSTLSVPERYEAHTFTLEDEQLHIIEQGRTDAVDSTSLHVPSIDLVVAGDVVYNRCHMFVAATIAESRDNWLEALDRLSALDPRTVVAGHKKPGAPDTPDAIAASKRYLTDFSSLTDSTSSDQELFDAMTDLYPGLGLSPGMAHVRILNRSIHRRVRVGFSGCAITERHPPMALR
ncbi:MAG: hypothetical protein J2P17_11995 [Mycobacterium sp.]|nr:hypothetical protein [Mycobacterium sp.]